jgi:HSP20 family molecular chaperone IbpA
VQSVCVLELPSDVDPSRSIAVLSDGVLGIRMPKPAIR